MPWPAEYLNGQVLDADGLNAIVRALSTHQGDVNAGGFDINNVGTLRCDALEWVGVLPVFADRQILAGVGLTGGGDLSADRTLSVVADTVTQRVEVLKAGALIATRRAVNLIEGANVSLTVADDEPNNRVNVTVASTLYYQTVQANGSAQAQRGKLNFSAEFAVADDSGNDRTNVSVASVAVSKVVASGTDNQVFYRSGNAFASTWALTWDGAMLTAQGAISSDSISFRNQLDAAVAGVFPAIYSTKSSGAAFPYLGTGFLVIQARLDAAGRMIVFYGGNPTARSIGVIAADSGNWGVGAYNTSPAATLHVYDATPATGITRLIIRAGAGQNTRLQEWQDGSGNMLAGVDSTGIFFRRADTGAGGATHYVLQTANGAARWAIGTVGVEGGSNSGSHLAFHAYNDAGSFLLTPLTIRRTGAIVHNGVPTAADDATLANGSLRWHLGSDTQLVFRVRGADGVVRQGTITLS